MPGLGGSARGAVVAGFALVSAAVAALEWALVAGDFSLRYVALNSSRATALVYRITALWGALEGSVVVALANPFERLVPVPPDGRGLNPLLENPAMVFHPPALYLGYAGFTVPFAFALAALITGRVSAEWIASTRAWTLVAWWALTAGILLGAWGRIGSWAGAATGRRTRSRTRRCCPGSPQRPFSTRS